MPNDIEKDIFKTISYFGFFEYPVTEFEIYKWMIDPVDDYSFFDIHSVLSESKWLAKNLDNYLGFYALKNAKKQVAIRRQYFVNAVEKRKKLKKVLMYLKRIPSVQCVALCNSMPFHFTSKKSDIDLFVIVDDGRLWSTRLSAVAPMIALKQRPGEAKKNPIDLSFFVSDKYLSFEGLKIEEKDPYLAIWIMSLVLFYESHDGIFNRFLAENTWANDMLPNAQKSLSKNIEKKSKIQLPIGFSEGFARWLQQKRMPERIVSLANLGSEVVVNEKMLKFHLNDRRREIINFMNDAVCKSEL